LVLKTSTAPEGGFEAEEPGEHGIIK
jgi:hypothetical protein